jgi:hypothetical protein
MEVQMKKMLLTAMSAIVLITLLACAPQVSINNDSAQVASIASGIADFALPDGYAPEFTARLLDYTMAAYNPGDGHSHLYLIQSVNDADREKLAQMLAELTPGSSDPKSRLTVTENRPVTVRGQEVRLVISDGVNSDGDAYRQATVAFQGKGGPALLVFSEPAERWDPATVDTLLASMQ